MAIDLLVQERITSTSMVPTVLRQLLESPLLAELAARRARRHRLRRGAGAARPDPPIETQFEPKVSPANGYGLTETTSAVVINSGADYFDHPDSVGRPVLGDRRAHRRPRTAGLPDGSIGEVWVRGPEHRQRLLEQARGHGGGVHRRLVPQRRPRPPRRRGLRLRRRPAEGRRHPRRRERVLRRGRGRAVRAPGASRDVADRRAAPPTYGEEVAAVVQRAAGVGGHRRPSCRSSWPRGWPASRCRRHVFFRDEPLPRTATGKVLKRDLRDELTGGARP